jgi:hypothetical protein
LEDLMPHTLSALRQLWRRSSQHQWSRLERDLPGSALPTAVVAPEDQHVVADSSELRHYLAAQTSQVV